VNSLKLNWNQLTHFNCSASATNDLSVVFFDCDCGGNPANPGRISSESLSCFHGQPWECLTSMDIHGSVCFQSTAEALIHIFFQLNRFLLIYWLFVAVLRIILQLLLLVEIFVYNILDNFSYEVLYTLLEVLDFGKPQLISLATCFEI
jgi:hypothetical protein